MFVGLAAIHPARGPAGFTAIGGGVFNTTLEDTFGRLTELIGRGLASGIRPHFEEDIPQSPALPLVFLFGFDPFPLEVHIVDQRVETGAGLRHFVEILVQACLVRLATGLILHFRESLLKTQDDEAGLH